MKLHVRLGPLPLEPPYFDLDEDDESDPVEGEEEVDLTDLFDPSPAEDRPPPAEILH